MPAAGDELDEVNCSFAFGVGGAGVELVGGLGFLPALIDDAAQILGLGVVGVEVAGGGQLVVGEFELVLLDGELGGEDVDGGAVGGEAQGIIHALAAGVEVAGLVLILGDAVEDVGAGAVVVAGFDTGLRSWVSAAELGQANALAEDFPAFDGL